MTPGAVRRDLRIEPLDGGRFMLEPHLDEDADMIIDWRGSPAHAA